MKSKTIYLSPYEESFHEHINADGSVAKMWSRKILGSANAIAGAILPLIFMADGKYIAMGISFDTLEEAQAHQDNHGYLRFGEITGDGEKVVLLTEEQAEKLGILA